MKVSVITICYNSGSTIEHAIRSVLAQDYPDVEYIIVDGLSSDNTMEVVRKEAGNRATVISEKDEGIYDAINKGIRKATGDVIGLLHSDDFYANDQVISRIVAEFKAHNVDGVYGDLQYVSKDNTEKVVRNWKSGPFKRGLFYTGWMPPHPTFYVKKSCYDALGVYNTEFEISADYELMLRFFEKHQLDVHHIPEVLVKMRVGGQSNMSLKNRFKANREDKLAWKVNGLKPGLFTITRKPLHKILQFFPRSGE